ncbi:MAG TPA: glycerol-3-phosphate 1-O-acyltransferase PlsY [bacterium]|nr:glycerol-3-phosphate 1-O-acyltransferase PlsY [bacterium]
MRLDYILSLLGAYLLGSIPTGLIIARSRGIDLYQVGSGATGATNVSRALGVHWAGLVALLDIAKSYFPTLLAIQLTHDTLLVCSIAFLVSVGHIFPVYVRFRGGKAVSTLVGALLAIMPVPTLIWIGAWAIIIKLFPVMSLVNLIMIGLLPPLLYLTRGMTYALFGLLMWLVIIFSHRQNIARLLQGKELTFGKTKENP